MALTLTDDSGAQIGTNNLHIDENNLFKQFICEIGTIINQINSYQPNFVIYRE